MRLACPMYIYPGPKTDAILAHKPYLVVINPNSGPGTARDANYTAVIRKAKAQGTIVIGYLTLDYTSKPMSAIQADIEKYHAFYPEIDGFFFDESPNDATTGLERVRIASALAKTLHPGAKICINPGVALQTARYGDYVEFAMTKENTAKGYLADVSPVPALYASTGVWHCAHTCAPDQISAVLHAMVSRLDINDMIWVTHDTDPNPYDAVPTMLAQVAALCTPATPPPPAPTGTVTVEVVIDGKTTRLTGKLV